MAQLVGQIPCIFVRKLALISVVVEQWGSEVLG